MCHCWDAAAKLLHGILDELLRPIDGHLLLLLQDPIETLLVLPAHILEFLIGHLLRLGPIQHGQVSLLQLELLDG